MSTNQYRYSLPWWFLLPKSLTQSLSHTTQYFRSTSLSRMPMSASSSTTKPCTLARQALCFFLLCLSLGEAWNPRTPVTRCVAQKMIAHIPVFGQTNSNKYVQAEEPSWASMSLPHTMVTLFVKSLFFLFLSEYQCEWPHATVVSGLPWSCQDKVTPCFASPPLWP